MSVTVDSKKRVRLARVNPGEEYAEEQPRPGLIVLRLQKPTEGNPLANLVSDTWEELGPAPEIDYDALPKR
jgi:hypothetical protein